MPDNVTFGGLVRASPRAHGQSACTGDVDNCAPTIFQHRRQHRLDAKIDTPVEHSSTNFVSGLVNGKFLSEMTGQYLNHINVGPSSMASARRTDNDIAPDVYFVAAPPHSWITVVKWLPLLQDARVVY